MIKCLPVTLKTWIRSLGWEDPLEKEMATHSGTLAWKIPWMEESIRHDRTTSLVSLHLNVYEMPRQ